MLNAYLHEQGIQFLQGGIWLLYQAYAGNGYTKTETITYEDREGRQHSKMHMKWTPKGRLFIYDLLRSHGILPTVEQPEVSCDE